MLSFLPIRRGKRPGFSCFFRMDDSKINEKLILFKNGKHAFFLSNIKLLLKSSKCYFEMRFYSVFFFL